MDNPKPDCLVPQRGWSQLIVNVQTSNLQGKEIACKLIRELNCPVPWLTFGMENCVTLQWTGKGYLSIWDDMMVFERNGQEPITLDPPEYLTMAKHINQFFVET